MLALPELNEPFEVVCDACGVGLRAVLLQDGGLLAFNGKRPPQAYSQTALTCYDVALEERRIVTSVLLRCHAFCAGQVARLQPY